MKHWWLPVVVGAVLAMAIGPQAQALDRFEAARRQLVEEHLIPEGIDNERVLKSMRSVPRHLFVRPDKRQFAYFDQALEIGYGQTISPPFIVAYMTQVLDPQPEDRVLEIGTGSGYQAAVLSSLVAEVYTIEIVEPLGLAAGRLLQRLGYDNVQTRVGDGYLGWPEAAPFDKIIVTCSPEKVPQPLIDQLKEGGKMIVPLGERYQQVFHLFEKREGELVETKLIPTLFVPMTGQSEALREVRPNPDHPRIVNGGFESATLREDQADNWHYQRYSTLVKEAAPEGRQYLQFENDVPGRSAQALQGFGLNGRTIGALKVTLRVRLEEIKVGSEPWELPCVVVHYYDQRRRSLGYQQLGPWTEETSHWQRRSGQLEVPRNAREAILRVGLCGATGRMAVDDLQIEAVPR